MKNTAATAPATDSPFFRGLAAGSLLVLVCVGTVIARIETRDASTNSLFFISAITAVAAVAVFAQTFRVLIRKLENAS